MNSYVLAGYLVTFIAIGGHVASLVVRQRRVRSRRAAVPVSDRGSVKPS